MLISKLTQLKKIFKRLRDNEKGFVLVGIMIVAVLSAMIGLSIFTSSTGELLLVETSSHQTQVLYTAQSGINYALRRLKDWNEWKTATWSNTPLPSGVMGNANVSYAHTDPIGTITSNGVFKGQNTQIVIKAIPTSPPKNIPFTSAGCGCSSITLTSNVDSYDSTDGSGFYGGGNVTYQGNIGSNGDVELGANGTVNGSVLASGNLGGGGPSSVSGAAILGGNDSSMDGTVTGGVTSNVNPVPSPCSCDVDINTPITAAATGNDNSDIPVSYLSGADSTDFSMNHGTLDLNTGTYYFTSFDLRGSGSINIIGNVVIYFTGAGDFDIGGNGMTNTSNNVGSLKIYSNSTADITFTGNSDFSGTVYAPSATVALTGSGAFYGAIVADTPSITGSGDLHYDTNLAVTPDALAAGTDDDIIKLNIISWKQN